MVLSQFSASNYRNQSTSCNARENITLRVYVTAVCIGCLRRDKGGLVYNDHWIKLLYIPSTPAIHIQALIRACVHVSVQMYIYIHIYTHMYTHMCIFVCYTGGYNAYIDSTSD